jgi:hypothetical protein
MLFLGILYALVGFVCVFFLIQKFRFRRASESFRLRVLFLITMTIWLFYRCIITIVPFDYTSFSRPIWTVCVNSLLLLLPLSFSILIQCTFLFLLRDPGVRRTAFFRVMFVAFLLAFFLIAIVVARATANQPKEMDRTMALWQSSTDLIIFIFSVIPSVQLYRLVVVVKLAQSPGLVRTYKYGIAGFFCIYLGRVIFNAVTYFSDNLAYDYLNPQPSTGGLSDGARALGFVTRLLFELMPAVCIIGLLRLLRPLEERYTEERNRLAEYSGTPLRTSLASLAS